MIEQVLIQNGFSDKEARIYLAALEAGEATFGSIAAKTRLKRSTVYSVVEELVTKQLLTIQARKGIKRISALAPQVLLERFRTAVNMAEGALPALLEMAYSSPLKPRVRFFEGMAGIKEVLLEVNTASKTERGMIITDYERMPKEIFDFIRKLTPERLATKNFLHIIVPLNPRSLEVQAEEDAKHYAEHRIAHFPKGNNFIELSLFGNTKVAFLSFGEGELFAVVVDSKAIYGTLKNLFELVWENATPKKVKA